MKKRYYLYFLALIIGLVFFLGEAASVYAQAEATEEFTLEEITVTAQKREQDQQKVPIAMDVITGEELAELGKDNVDDILKDVANIMINTTSSGMRISMRGIVDDSDISSGQQVGGTAVAINIDGAYNNMGNAGQNLYDVERVEVLFGPQSTMYGSNSPGGVVNVITAAPKTDKYSASATVEWGSFNLLNTQAVLNAPVIQDKVAMRLALSKNKQNSFVDPDETGSKSTNARLKTLWSVYEDLSVTVTGNWQKNANGGMMGGTVKPFNSEDGYWLDTTTGERLGKVTDPWTPADTQTGGGGPGGVGPNTFDQITKGVSGEINWQTFIGNISAVPSYSKTSASGNQSSLESDGTTTSWTLDDSNVQKGAELRMTNASDFTLFDWIFGGTYYKSVQKRIQEYTSGSVNTGAETLNKKKALYGNITYPLWFNDKLKLTLGYRQSWDENLSWENDGARQSGNPEGYNKPDLKYGFEYDAADSLMFYGSFSSSYRSANAMGQPDASGEIPDPEELDAYAIGMKSRWFENKLQVNVNAYYYDYANKLGRGFKEATGLTEEDFGYDAITAATNDRGDTTAEMEADGYYPTRYDSNGDGVIDYSEGTEDAIYVFKLNDPNSQGSGAFTSLGFDLQTNWVVTSSDRVNFSIAYLDSKWKTLKFHYYWYMIFPDENYKNVIPTNSPKLSMTASYEHNFILGSYGTLTPRIDAQYKSEYELVWNYQFDGDPYGIGHQDAYTLFDASAVFNHAGGRWSLSGYVKNITDYAVKRSYMGMGQMSLMIGDPRTYGLTLSAKF